MHAILGIEYLTQPFDRLDKIAYQFYGDAADISPLVEANPSVPLTPVLPAGLMVVVPLKRRARTLAQVANLPPWKR
jgi:phage tail protein X